MPDDLRPSDLTEYVYTITEGLYNTQEWKAWTVMNKTKRFLHVASFEERHRINRRELEETGEVWCGQARKHFYLRADPKYRVCVAPVWLTERESAEEAERLKALKTLGEKL
jgi:hypothetical protein